MQSTFEFLQFIHDFLESDNDNNVTTPIYIFHIVSVREEYPWSNGIYPLKLIYAIKTYTLKKCSLLKIENNSY